MRRLLSVLATTIALLLLCGGVINAHAASYVDMVAGHLNDKYAWQDPGVSIINSSELDQIESKIESSGKPIYVAIVDQSMMPSTDSKSYPSSLYGAMKRNGVYIVIGVKAFRAASFETSYEVAKRTPEIAAIAFNNAKMRGATKPDFQAIDELVSGIIPLDFTIPASGPTIPAPAQDNRTLDLSWLWWMLATIFVGGIIAVLFYFIRAKREKKRLEEKQRLHEEATAERRRKQEEEFVNYTPPQDNPSPEEREAAKDHQPTARKRKSPKNPHYWSGGHSNGSYYPAGYYPDRFWEGYVIGSMSGGHHTHHDKSHDEPTQGYAPQGAGNDHESSTHSSGYSGGGDFGKSPAPVYRAPSPASPASPPRSSSSNTWSSSSFGGGDFGGSSSSGGFSSGGSGGGDF